jgi:signal transduction histidine kinase
MNADMQHTTPELPAPGEDRRVWWQHLISIRYAIIVPYVILTLVIAVLGIFVVTRLIASSIEDRFAAQMLEAGAVANDGLVRQEQRHLEVLRPMVQTIGVAASVQSRDVAKLRDLIEVQAYNANLDSVLALNQGGELILRLDAVRTLNPEVIDSFATSAGGSYANLPMVAPVLAGFQDARGDKFSGLVDTPAGPMLYSSSAILDDSGQLAGVMMVGTSLDRILVHIKAESLADIVVYTRSGAPLDSTLPDWDQPAQLDVLTIDAATYQTAISNAGNTQQRSIKPLSLFEREYRAIYTPMLIRTQMIGVMGVVLPERYVVNTVTISRNTFVAIFTGGIILTVIIGMTIAARIARPIFDLVTVTRAIAGGDLTQRARVLTPNELETLAQTLNIMTSQLEKNTEQLEEDNARTSAILNSIADGIIVRNPRGEILLANPAAKEMLSGEDGFDPLRLQAFSTFAIAHDQNEHTRRIEIDTRMISISMAKIYLDDGDYTGDVLVLRDITAETMAERTKDNFLNQISHELRTPLTAIKGYADLLRMSSDKMPPDKRTRAFDTIFNSSQVLSQMVDQMIDLTAMQSGSMVLYSEQIDLRDLIQSVAADWEQPLAVAGLTIKVSVPRKSVKVLADARRLERALQALLDNACDFSPGGGVVQIGLTADSKEAVIAVTDPGVGIDKRDLPHVFERFYRGNPRRTDGSPIDVRGMGQGLFVVKSVIEAHGGRVSVESEAGQGSTFRLSLPLVPRV